jgi:hypothetical protein
MQPPIREVPMEWPDGVVSAPVCLLAMSSKHSRSRRHVTPTERPLLAERIQRNPILKFLGSLMVGQAMWRRKRARRGQRRADT